MGGGGGRGEGQVKTEQELRVRFAGDRIVEGGLAMEAGVGGRGFGNRGWCGEGGLVMEAGVRK